MLKIPAWGEEGQEPRLPPQLGIQASPEPLLVAEGNQLLCGQPHKQGTGVSRRTRGVPFPKEEGKKVSSPKQYPLWSCISQKEHI